MVYIVNFSVFAISLCFGMGTTITGLVIRNRIIQVCGLIAGIGGFFGALHFLGHTQLYVMAVVALIGLSVQIDKLSAAGYIEVEKTFKGKKPCTLCRITPVGLKAFEDYVKALKSYLNVKKT